MMKIVGSLFFFFGNFQFIFSQQDSTLVPNNTNHVSFIQVDCDSSGLDIYINDILVGKSPIDSPIPIKPGVHVVSYLNPQFVGLLKQYYSMSEIESILNRSLQRVYVSKGKTLTVNLWWKPYEKHLIARKRFVWIKSFIGLFFITMIFFLNL
ncbi:MAG: hypothetical protein ACJZ02_01835 [Candidatus Neomarinimicrobiota bacterium]